MKKAPENWLLFFQQSGLQSRFDQYVPKWMTLRHVKKQNAVATELQQLLGDSFCVEYSPGGSIDDFGETQGHCIEVTIDDIEPILAFDTREDFRGQIADWFEGLANRFTEAANKLRDAHKAAKAGDS